MKICQVDSDMIFTGKIAVMFGPRFPIPRGHVQADPPKGEGIWQWQSTKWTKLPQRPVPPPMPPVVKVTKTELVERLKADGTYDAWKELIKEKDISNEVPR